MNEGSGYSLDFEDASHTGDFIEKASKTASKWQIFQINVKHRKTIFVALFVVCIYALSFLQAVMPRIARPVQRPRKGLINMDGSNERTRSISSNAFFAATVGI